MAALEYLTLNELTSHPFKSGRSVIESSPNKIESDWFYDILFVNYVSEIKRVFIKSIEKKESGELIFVFGDSDTNLRVTATIYNTTTQTSTTHSPESLIPAYQVVNHYKNLSQSFAYSTTELYSVKLVLGPGLVNKGTFTQTYTIAEAELTSNSIVLRPPSIRSLTFSKYTADYVLSEETKKLKLVATLSKVKSYEYPDVPILALRYNTAYESTGTASGDLSVGRAFGAGLYDGCPKPGEITDLFTVNNITPNSSGALFLNASSCYTAKTLTASEKTTLDSLGYLDKYYDFTLPLENGSVEHKDIVSLGSSIIFENFCKPKCPPENMAAFAYYLNRVADGVKELDYFATKNIETRGQGNAELRIFTASSFCSDNVFDRCAEPQSPGYIECGTAFIKYFHEGCTLELYYDNVTRYSFKIVEVLDSTSVRLDNPPPASPGEYYSFRVLDNGVVGNMNCAAAGYNLNSEELLNPYFKVNYTTSEAFNTEGNYVTYLAVVVSVFNPSSTAYVVRIDFTHNNKLQQQGNYKIRNSSGVYSVSTPISEIACRSYAFFEAVYYIGCGESGGALSVSAVDDTSTTQIGNTYVLPNINGADCPGTVTGSGSTIQTLNTANGVIFSSTYIALNTDTYSVAFASDVPAWLSLVPNYALNSLAISTKQGETLPALNNNYVIYFRSYGGEVPGVITQLIFVYIARPSITSPTAGIYQSAAPLQVSKLSTYTSANPLLQVTATNMVAGITTNPQDLYYVVEGELPTGLVFDNATGKLTGKLDISVLEGTSFDLTFTAHNPAGYATSSRTVYFYTPGEGLPVMINDSGESYTTSNLNIYTTELPLLTLRATNAPIYRYILSGDSLPLGLILTQANSVGKITGKVSALSSGSAALHAEAVNSYGMSDPIDFTIAYDVYPKPEITFPENLVAIKAKLLDSYPEEAPLFQVQATESYTGTNPALLAAAKNVFSASSLPPGFEIDSQSGKVTGQLSSSVIPETITPDTLVQYVTQFTVTNNTGSHSVFILLYFSETVAPVIYGIQQNTIFDVVRQAAYNLSTNKLLVITATGEPSSFSVTGLPTGLSSSGNGVIGSVNNAIPAGDYIIAITATNDYGTSTAVTAIIRVPIFLEGSVSSIELELNKNYSSIFYITATPLTDETIVYTNSTIPPGLAFDYSQISGKYVLSGTPTSLGSQAFIVTGTTENYGTSTVSLSINVVPKLYSISGRIVDDGVPASGIYGVSVSAGGTLYTTTTDASGYYTLTGVGAAAYNVYTASDIYEILPAFRAVTVSTAAVANVNFIAAGPFRSISGKISLPGGEALSGIAVAAQTGKTGVTDASGIYNLSVPLNIQSVVTPSSTGYSYSPATRTYPAGNTDIIDVDFTATVIETTGIPTALSVSFSGLSASLSFTPPATGLSNVTGYAYSTDNGATWTNSSNALNSPSPIAITGPLLPGTYYNFSVRALNGSLPSTTSLTITAKTPNVPTTPALLMPSMNGSTLTINFVKSTSRGSEITGYQYSLDGGSTWTSAAIANLTTPSPIVVQVLSDNTTVQVTVRAVSAIGNSGYSGAMTAKTSGVPGPPTIVAITPRIGMLSMLFNPPISNGGSPILDYQYSTDSTAEGNGTYGSLGRGSNTSIYDLVYSSDGQLLVNGTAYTIALRAVNIYGVGPSFYAPPTTPATLPSAPTITSATVSSINSTTQIATVAINFTAGSNGGSEITSYLVASEEDGLYTTVPNAQKTSPLTVTGLALGRTYSFKIKAVTAVGESPESNAITLLTAVAPSPPTLASSATVTSGGFAISFTPGFNGGLPIQAHHYSLSTDNGSTWSTPVRLLYITPQISVASLTVGETYKIKVAAENSLGTIGDYSTPSNGVFVGAIPGAPIITDTESGDASVALYFTAPTVPSADPSLAITSYRYSVNGGITINMSRTTDSSVGGPYIITSGLTENARSVVRVFAGNSYGLSQGSNPVSVGFKLAGRPTLTYDSFKTSDTEGTITLTITPPTYIGPAGSTIGSYLYSQDLGINWIASLTPTIVIPDVPADIIKTYVAAVVVNTVRGQTSTSILAKVPSTPAPPVVTLTTFPDSLKVNYDWASFTGGAITGFYLNKDGGEQGLFMGNTAPGSYTVTGLGANSTYSFGVYLVTSGGTSEVTSIAGSTEGNAPGQATISSISADYDNIYVSFSRPSGDITKYKYALNQEPAHELTLSTTEANLELTIPTETAGIYEVQIYACNYSLCSISEIRSITVAARTVPALCDFSVSSPAEGTILVTLNSVPSNGGAAITKYTVYLDSPSQSNDYPSNQTSFTYSGLSDGSTYEVYCYATNSIGTAAEKSHQSYKIPGVPADISSLLLSEYIDSASVKIEFTDTNNVGALITDYEYAAVQNGPPEYPTWISTGRTTPGVFMVGNLQTLEYKLYLRAINRRGFFSGPYLSVLFTPRELLPPTTPIISTITRDYTYVTIDFTINEGRPISYYQYSFTANSGWINFSSSPLVVSSGLTQGVSRTVYIRAVNGDGASTATQASIRLKDIETASAPLNLTLEPGHLSFAASFDTPADLGGGTISSYRYFLNDGVEYGPFTATYPTFNILNLTYNQQYTVMLWAVNQAGAGAVAQTSATAIAYPDPPVGVTQDTGYQVTGELRITWAPPDNAQLFSSITYTVVVETSNTYTQQITGNSVIVYGLTSGSSYYAEVTATADGRTSAPIRTYVSVY